MSSAKVQVVIHDNHGGWTGHNVPGVITGAQPFFGYVLGNPDLKASGRSKEEVLEKIRDSLVFTLVKDRRVTREIVELDVGDHILAFDVMNG